MYEINKKVAYEDLMEKIYELVTVCGGWDAECRNVKPGVEEQLERVTHAIRQSLDYDPTTADPEDAA
jgi:hypothetical protein